MRIEKMGVYYKAKLYGDEYVDVFIDQIVYQKGVYNQRTKVEGYVDVIYPFAGYDLNLSLPIYNVSDKTRYKEFIEELGGETNEIESYIKIPFEKRDKFDLGVQLALFYHDKAMADEPEDGLVPDFLVC